MRGGNILLSEIALCAAVQVRGEKSKMIMRDGHVWDTERHDLTEALVVPSEIYSAMPDTNDAWGRSLTPAGAKMVSGSTE